jgi:predicted HicB family RNase H-like nuclease
MKKSSKTISSTADLEARFVEINAQEPEEPTKEDLEAIAKATAESPEENVSLEEYKLQREYSGRLLLRIPKELHKQLVESAKENGVSLNQYALYKLAR